MKNLYMGKIDRSDQVFKINVDDLEAHTFITGQSGCGKSSIVSRLIEEIIIREAGSVVLLDYNFEFSKFNQVDDDSFNKSWNKRNCEEDEKDSFKSKWSKYSDGFNLISSNLLNIYYADINSEAKAFLYGIDRDKDAGAFWLIQLIDQEPHKKLQIRSKDALRELIYNMSRWYERRIASDDYEIEEVIHQIKQFVNMLDFTKFLNGANRLIRQSYINFKKTMPTKLTLNNEFFDTFLII